jgi:hypothetical protein
LVAYFVPRIAGVFKARELHDPAPFWSMHDPSLRQTWFLLQQNQELLMAKEVFPVCRSVSAKKKPDGTLTRLARFDAEFPFVYPAANAPPAGDCACQRTLLTRFRDPPGISRRFTVVRSRGRKDKGDRDGFGNRGSLFVAWNCVVPVERQRFARQDRSGNASRLQLDHGAN